MLHTSELDMAELVKTSDIDVFLSDATWAVCSTYHTVLKASPGAAIFGQDMLFDIPFIAGWQKIGEYCLVWATKVALAAICLVFPALVLGYKSFNASMYHVPVPT